jgi:hypothetical protein
MRAFFIRGVRQVEQEMETLADSPQDAAKRFREAFPGFNVDIVQDAHNQEWESFGMCEGCARELFSGDTIYSDSDELGLEFCEECFQKSQSEDSQ